PEPNLTYNVGVIAGGTPAEIDAEGFNVTASGKTNIVASTAIARGDLRTLTPEQDARVRARMLAIVDDHLPRTDAELAFGETGYPPMAPTEGNRALLARLNAVNRDLGLPEMAEYDPARRGAADSGFVAADVDTLGGLGVAGGNAHAEGEWVDLDSLVRQSRRAAVLSTRLRLGCDLPSYDRTPSRDGAGPGPPYRDVRDDQVAGARRSPKSAVHVAQIAPAHFLIAVHVFGLALEQYGADRDDR